MTCWMDERTRDGGDRLMRPAAQTPMGDTLGLGECCGAGIHKYSSWMKVCSKFWRHFRETNPKSWDDCGREWPIFTTIQSYPQSKPDRVFMSVTVRQYTLQRLEPLSLN